MAELPWKLRFFVKKRQKFKILLKKFWISEFHRFFAYIYVIQKDNNKLNMICKFQLHNICRYFSKWRLKISSNWKKVATTPHSQTVADGSPYPPPGYGTPNCFHQNDRKECFGAITKRFGATRKNKNRIRGLQPPPWLDEGYYYEFFSFLFNVLMRLNCTERWMIKELEMYIGLFQMFSTFPWIRNCWGIISSENSLS